METGRKIYELATINQANDASKFNIHNWISARWAEQWTDRLSTNSAYTYRETSYEGRDGSEDAHQLLVSARYYMRHDLGFVFDIAYTKIEDSLGKDVSRQTITFRIDFNL